MSGRQDPGDPAATVGDEGIEPAGGLPTEARIFLVTGLFAGTIGAVYAVSSDGEWAGTVSLAAAAIFGLVLAAFMGRGIRDVQHSVRTAEQTPTVEQSGTTPAAPFAPRSSVWPLGIGVGTALAFAGLAFGVWFIIPGAALSAGSVIGLASQSRRRSPR